MADDQEAAEVTVTVTDGVGTVIFNRPERRNALDAELVDAIGRAFDRLEADESVRCVVVTGAGRAFSAGAVLDTLIASADGEFDSVVQVYEGFLRVLRSPLPTIAAVNGPAVGAGLNIALACDVRIASTAASFDSRFPTLRLHPGGGHSWLLGRAVGRQTATLMALFGETLDATAALREGLVAAVYEPDELLAAADALARRVRDMDRSLVEKQVDTLRRAEQTVAHADILALETDRQRWSTAQPEFVRNTRELQERISEGRR